VDDVVVGGLDDGDEFGAFATRDLEAVAGLAEVVDEGFPFVGGDLEMLVGIEHGFSGVDLWASGGPADHFSDEVFETRGGDLVVGIIDEGGDGVDASESFVEGGF